jgi:hypothetical protein
VFAIAGLTGMTLAIKDSLRSQLADFKESPRGRERERERERRTLGGEIGRKDRASERGMRFVRMHLDSAYACAYV